MKKRWLMVVFLGLNSFCYALPFSIVPKSGTSLPTFTIGGSATAFYTVTNNTASQRNNNFVKYLPPNVSQVTSGGFFSDTCGSTFNLAAAGLAGSSCTLQLNITGLVNGSDTNPHDHLFVCFPGGTSCAGTEFSLNVTETFAGRAYIANSGNNSISFCTINSDNTLIDCVSTGTNINGPFGIILDALRKFAYIVNRGTNSTTICSVNANGTLSACASTGSGFSGPSGIALNPANTFAYITNASGSNRVSVCTVNSNTGLLSACTITGSLFADPIGIAINPLNTFAYIADPIIGVFVCAINSTDGTLNSCTATGSGFSGPAGIAINTSNTFIYVSNSSDNTVTVCRINTSDGTLSNCTVIPGFNNPGGITLNPSNTLAYISNLNNTVSVCRINNTTGLLNNCNIAGAGFNSPVGLFVI